MQELKIDEMLKIEGGASFSASMLNAIYKTIQTIYSVGEALGSYIRRIKEGKMCNI